MFDDTYRTIASPAEGIYKEKGSKFLAFAFPVQNQAEVKEHLESIRKEYFDARHHCYAYILGPYKDAFRVNDDGEPSGTGGKPIHGQLLSFDLTNTLIIVVRYFGGIKLGVSGLINAYRTAARDALDHAVIEERTIDHHYRVCYEYPMMNQVMRLLKEYDTLPRNLQFSMDCSLEFSIRQSLSTRIYDAFIRLRGVTIEEIL